MTPPGSVFQFKPRWKEELVVTGPGGTFVLELSMGILTACLPPQELWPEKSPAWARDLWPTLKTELEAWCRAYGAQFIIDPAAGVWFD
jgi:hypothetical protein